MARVQAGRHASSYEGSMIKPATGMIRWFLTQFGYGGITLPPFGIYILVERMHEPDLVRHENVHWVQYKELGLIKFYALYLWFNLRYGYQNNPMERHARGEVRHFTQGGIK
jgi:hypothetical protein